MAHGSPTREAALAEARKRKKRSGLMVKPCKLCGLDEEKFGSRHRCLKPPSTKREPYQQKGRHSTASRTTLAASTRCEVNGNPR